MDHSENQDLQDDNAQKKARHRKKQLFTNILQQMEFYFSDSNLTKDRFLSQLIQENQYIDLSIFLKFNKIRKLTLDLDDIRKAIRKSDIIQLSEDGKNVYRKSPMKVKENVDECTIYVEKIKADATHEWVASVFSELGNVVYVSIPKYKLSKVNKGFAFVEFEMEKEAEHALEFFESIGCKMPSHLKPEDLCSIVSYLKEQESSNIKEEENESSEEKITILEDSSKKRKRSDENGDNEHKKMKNEEESADEVTKETVTENENSDERKKKKLKKEHKKKNHIKELGLQVLSKKEWKKMRNHYLDSQKKKMKEFKTYLVNKRFSQQAYNQKNKEQESGNIEQDRKQSESVPKLEFIPGVIVKVKLMEPCSDPKKIKQDIKSATFDTAKYVDTSASGNLEIFVRFNDSSEAQDFSKHEGFGEKAVLNSEEEKKYWEKIQSDRQIKIVKTNKKQRGRDKLLKKAKKEMAKHTRFDDES